MNTELSLSKFRANIADFARPNRFEVSIAPPSVYQHRKTDADMLSWLAESAQIPARTQGERVLKYHGMQLILSGDFTKENITIGFLNSYGWEGRRFFEDWIELCQKINGDNSRTGAGELIGDSSLTIIQRGRIEKDNLAEYVFESIVPLGISAIDLGNANNDTIEKFTVNFGYSHFYRKDGNLK